MPMFPKVLVVDDSKVDCRIVGGLLEKDPFLQIKYAENGLEALDMIRGELPDIVLTDLRMPEMDGLTLVRIVGREQPMLPVILITAHGSGALALEALEQGAASYVPKAQLADRLLDTVRRTLGKADVHQNYERLLQYQRRTEFSFRVENKPSLVDALSALVQESTATMRLFDARVRIQFAVAFEQAFLNAIYHGNLEISYDELTEERERIANGKSPRLVESRRSMSPYGERRVDVDLYVSCDEARIVVRDEGPGFDVTALPDWNDPAELETTGGHGLTLMRAFTDELLFNEKGNEVTLVRWRSSSVRPREASLSRDA
ncbi:MAG: response regulator [Pirellulales bacterium]